MNLKYINLGTSTKTYYDVVSHPGDVSLFPGYINDPNFLYFGTEQDPKTWADFPVFLPLAAYEIDVVWDDTGATDPHPTSLTAMLAYDVAPPSGAPAAISLSDSNSWSGTIKVPVFKDAETPIEWTWQLPEVASYNVTIVTDSDTNISTATYTYNSPKSGGTRTKSSTKPIKSTEPADEPADVIEGGQIDG